MLVEGSMGPGQDPVRIYPESRNAIGDNVWAIQDFALRDDEGGHGHGDRALEIVLGGGEVKCGSEVKRRVR